MIKYNLSELTSKRVPYVLRSYTKALKGQRMQVWGQSRIAKENRIGAKCLHLGSLFSNFPIPYLLCNCKQHLKECQVISLENIKSYSFSLDPLMSAWPWMKSKAHIKMQLERQCHPVQACSKIQSKGLLLLVPLFGIFLFLHICLSKLYLSVKIQLKHISSSKPYLELIHPFL